MDRVFVYWDNSHVFHEAQRLADQLEGTSDARYLVRIHFDNLVVATWHLRTPNARLRWRAWRAS